MLSTTFGHNKSSISTACGIIVPHPGIEPSPPALEAQSLNHQTARKVPLIQFLSQARPNHGVERGGRKDPVSVWTSMWCAVIRTPFPGGRQSYLSCSKGHGRISPGLFPFSIQNVLVLVLLSDICFLPHTFLLCSPQGTPSFWGAHQEQIQLCEPWAVPWALVLLFPMPSFNNLPQETLAHGHPLCLCVSEITSCSVHDPPSLGLAFFKVLLFRLADRKSVV